MIKKIVIPLLVVVVIILAVFYVKLGPPPQKVTVRIITPPSIIASLPIWVAEERGLFSAKKLDVEFISLTSSDLMVEGLLAGNADVLPAVSLATLTSKGGPGNLALMHVKIYSHSRMRKNPPFESILVSAGSRLSSLLDLEGKKIAVYPGMTSELTVRYFLKKNGVNVDRITFVKLPPPEHEPALLRNDVSAIHVYEPFRTASLSNGKTRELFGSVYAALCEPSGIGVSAISREFLRKHPEAASRYLDVWDEAISFIREHPDDARQILSHKLGLPFAIAKSATWVDVTKTTETSFKILHKTVKAFKLAGVIPNNFILEKDMVLKR